MDKDRITWNVLYGLYEAWREFEKTRRGVNLADVALGYGPDADLCRTCITDLTDWGMVIPLLGVEGVITEEGRSLVSKVLAAPIETQPSVFAALLNKVRLK